MLQAERHKDIGATKSPALQAKCDCDTLAIVLSVGSEALYSRSQHLYHLSVPTGVRFLSLALLSPVVGNKRSLAPELDDKRKTD